MPRPDVACLLWSHSVNGYLLILTSKSKRKEKHPNIIQSEPMKNSSGSNAKEEEEKKDVKPTINSLLLTQSH